MDDNLFSCGALNRARGAGDKMRHKNAPASRNTDSRIVFAPPVARRPVESVSRSAAEDAEVCNTPHPMCPKAFAVDD